MSNVGCMLLVSNDAATIQQLKDSTQPLAMSLEISTELPAALDRLDQHKFEAVVVDLGMGERAKEVLQKVRLSASNRTAVMFAVTNSDAEVALAFQAGSRFVLERPLSVASISHTLKAAYGLIVRERRRYFRCPIVVPAALRRRGMQEVHCQTVNISEGGMAMSGSVPLSPGQQVDVQFTLPGHPQFAAESTICWLNSDQIGLRFVSLPVQQQLALQEWLSGRLEAMLPESVAEQFRKSGDQ